MRRDAVYLEPSWRGLEGQRILVAGCGGEGSNYAVALGSALLGVKDVHMTLIDPDKYSKENVGIQEMGEDDIGLNKAVALRRRLQRNFPGISVEAIPEPFSDSNAEELVTDSTFVYDGLDIGVPAVAETLLDIASERGVPAVLSWTLGLHSATTAFRNPGDYRSWGREAQAIAVEHDLEAIAPLAQWLVRWPDGMSVDYLQRLLAGNETAPTPATGIGGRRGGAVAAEWTLKYTRGEEPAAFPYITMSDAPLVAHTNGTNDTHFATLTRSTLLQATSPQ